MHLGTCEGPAYDMPKVVTRMVQIGMPLPALIRSTTIAPPEAIGFGNRIGMLGIGREADITVLSEDEVALDLEDCQGHLRRISKRLRAAAVWRAGKRGTITEPPQWPNPDILEGQRTWWPRLLVRDPSL